MTTLETIDLSPAPNTGNGDPIRDGGQKINNNFTKLFALARVVQENTLQVYKAIGNTNIDALESGDIIVGWFNSTTFADKWRYNSGNVGDASSYTVLGGTIGT